jgi:hypothetical protein
VVEPGQPDPGIFRPDFFVLTPIPVYNVPIIRYIDYLINNTGYSARIIQYGWSGAEICQPGQTRDPATGACSKCPVDRLPDFPPPNDPCAQSLEAGSGVDGTGACGTLTPEMQQQEQCLADKIRALGIPYTRPTSTVRTVAYQDHLAKIWEKWEELKNLPEEQVQACAKRKKEIEDEKNKHELTFTPPPANPIRTHTSTAGLSISTGNSCRGRSIVSSPIRGLSIYPIPSMGRVCRTISAAQAGTRRPAT